MMLLFQELKMLQEQNGEQSSSKLNQLFFIRLGFNLIIKCIEEVLPVGALKNRLKRLQSKNFNLTK